MSIQVLATSAVLTSDYVRTRQALGRRHEGQTMTEYVAVLGVISIAVILALTAFGGKISAALNAISGLI